MIEITCDTVQMINLIKIFEDSDECLLECLYDGYCDSCCDYDFNCAKCLSKNIKWNIID